MEKINYKLLAWLSVLLLVLLIVFYVIEFDYIGNTIGFNHLVVKSLVVAFFAGILLGLHFQKKGKEQVDRIRIWSASLLLPLFFAPWLGSLTNRMMPRNAVIVKSFEFVEERPFAASAYGFLQGETVEEDGCYLFVYYEGEIHRLKRKKCEFHDRENGDVIDLPVRKGLWGYEVVDR